MSRRQGDGGADAAATGIAFKTRLSGWALAWVMRLIFFTSRKRYTNLQALRGQLDSGQPFILVSWHNRNILASFGYTAHSRTPRRFSPLASASRDGTLAAMAMRALGVECIRGSSSAGGAAALRQMLKAVKSGQDLGITPDGPRGPKYVVQAGVVTTARLAGVPIIPMAWQARRRKELRSWDAMIVPYPFNRLHFAYGDPIRIPRDADAEALEQGRLQVEQALMDLVARVEVL